MRRRRPLIVKRYKGDGLDAESIQDLQQLADQVTSSDLESIAPEDAVEMYLSDRNLRRNAISSRGDGRD